MTAETIWAQASELLKKELSVGSFEGFISSLSAAFIQNATLVLKTDSQFNRELLEERYTDIAGDAVRSVSGLKEVRFIVAGEEEAVPRAYTGINPRYTLDSFVIGPSNSFAHAACNAIVSNVGNLYNPMFIYGNVGLGKTHLMHAVGNGVLKKRPGAQVMYVTSETFTSELITSLRKGLNEQFREKYRGVDVLMIDDIQFIADKESTQEEFFHTFNTLYNANKQILISSDKPPKEILKLEERLRSRFEGGLIADIQPPEIETRVAILQKKAEEEKVTVPEEVLYYIASKVDSNIRELEGSLNRVIAASVLEKKPLNVELTQRALRDLLSKDTKRPIDIGYIKEMVCDYYSLSQEELTSKRRNREVSFPRQIAMYLCRELTEASLPQIGEVFGGRDHTTVMHACNKISVDIKEDLKIKTSVEDIVKRLTE